MANKVKVAYYEAEVKYTGRFEDYTLEEWIEKARYEATRKDCFYKIEEEEEDFAKVIDGKYYVENRFPCNKLAYVQWAYIVDEEEEDE